ncbi:MULTISPECIES: acyl carrier protein [Lactobacillus]|jgi:acyl carrier protein|uniref:Acyl carrier protein n=1 Tax=Lactobacillus gallinarum TaxID=52242 RepID=A0A1Y4QA33_9LACO|nr:MULTISPECIES: acyl carrier protein [Lactobacillus]MBL1060669.1 acyl carrier protein [Lactobacillus sp. A27]MBM6957800.1 acyl carrier protein [Lactobacillus gallinarum]MBM6972296.1 acyl carrier protein [Lactobacillus gallinarum]MCC9272138.1 acyl carrier protein [Lactobacillus gallinarum]MDM8281934.1 acyl carrier protein [Lactobacillus gallinarum]
MTKEEILKDVQEIAQDELDVEPEKITMDTNIKEDLDADSLDLFEILNELEDKYDIELDADDSIQTISQLVDFVKDQMDKQK